LTSAEIFAKQTSFELKTITKQYFSAYYTNQIRIIKLLGKKKTASSAG